MIKDLISEVRKDNCIIKHKEEELQRLQVLCEISGISYGGEKGSTSRNTNKQEQSYLEYIEFKDALARYICDALAKRKQLMELIDKLQSKQEIDILYKYCFENLSLRQIAEATGYTKQAIHKIYLKALENLEKELTKVDES